MQISYKLFSQGEILFHCDCHSDFNIFLGRQPSNLPSKIQFSCSLWVVKKKKKQNHKYVRENDGLFCKCLAYLAIITRIINLFIEKTESLPHTMHKTSSKYIKGKSFPFKQKKNVNSLVTSGYRVISQVSPQKHKFGVEVFFFSLYDKFKTCFQ